LEKEGRLKSKALTGQVAAISCGVTEGGVVLDMDYAEDSTTIADGNFVMSGDGAWVEMQVSAEQRPISQAETNEMQRLAELGIRQLFDLQNQSISASL
jgi:ribonuclease PH